MMQNSVHVVCATNSSYIMPLSVMLASLVDNFDPERKLVIHIISNDASDKDRESVRASILMNRPSLANIETHWYSYDPSLLAGVHLLTYFTLDAYSRLLAPLLLPASCEKVIYLDCDIVVLADVSRLYDSVTDEAMIHAAQDMATPFVSSKLGVFDYRERGIPPETVYFNSGVMVLNFKRWRRQNVTEALIDYLSKNAGRIYSVDQGALNALLWNDRVIVDPRWNQGFDIVFFDFWATAGHSREEWLRVKKDPYIIHFSGEKKPWQRGRRGPRYSYFYRYLEKTVFKGSIPHRPYLENVIGFPTYFQLWRIARAVPGLIKR